MKKYLFILISISCFAQFNPVQWYDFGHGNYEPNTFIGGVGGTINTPALLAARLNVNVNSIKKFSVISGNLKCAIVNDYNLAQNFNSDTSITYYEDYGKTKDLTMYTFRYCTNLKRIILPGLTILKSDAIYSNSNLVLLDLPNVVSIGNTSISPNNGEVVNLPKCVNFGTTTGQDGVFYPVSSWTGFVINANAFLQTCNGGSPDGDLVYAISQGATVNYIP